MDLQCPSKHVKGVTVEKVLCGNGHKLNCSFHNVFVLSIRNYVKLGLYRSFTNTLVCLNMLCVRAPYVLCCICFCLQIFAVILSVGFMIWSISFIKRTDCLSVSDSWVIKLVGNFNWSFTSCRTGKTFGLMRPSGTLSLVLFFYSLWRCGGRLIIIRGNICSSWRPKLKAER